ncbi:MAG: MAPEG family protein [Woeseiaceae bacterium]
MLPVLYPVFALFLLTAFSTLRLAGLRLSAIKKGEVNPKFYRDYQGFEEPMKLRVASRHVINLYEAPVLFYTISIIAFVTQVGGFVIVALAWAYVVLRYLHSYVHLTSNNVLLRFRLFASSQAILVAIWITVFVGVLQQHAA